MERLQSCESDWEDSNSSGPHNTQQNHTTGDSQDEELLDLQLNNQEEPTTTEDHQARQSQQDFQINDDAELPILQLEDVSRVMPKLDKMERVSKKNHFYLHY